MIECFTAGLLQLREDIEKNHVILLKSVSFVITKTKKT